LRRSHEPWRRGGGSWSLRGRRGRPFLLRRGWSRPYGDGWLQLEMRTYERKKSGGASERGPYWYFRYHEGGRQRKLYLGKTDDPEAEVEERRRGGGG
jgi:hypothetical protein